MGDIVENMKDILIKSVHNTVDLAARGELGLSDTIAQLNATAGAIWAELNRGLAEQEIYVGYNGGQGLRLTVAGLYLGQLSNAAMVDNYCGSWLEELRDIEYLLVRSAEKI